jgi:hypothetical protein
VGGPCGSGWWQPGELFEMQGDLGKVERIEAGQVVGSLQLVAGH